MNDAITVLPVLPWTAAAVALVLLVGLAVPPRSAPVDPVETGGSAFLGRWSSWAAVEATLALVVLARTGPASEVRNPVSSLVVGLGWPLLFVLPVLVRRRRGVGVDDVRPAVLAAAAVVGYLAVVPDRARPSLLAAALATYAVVVLAVGIALGRRTAARLEVLGLLASWTALGPDLPRWRPPRGAAPVLALVLGGAWHERVQRSTDAPPRQVLLLGSVLLAGAIAAGLLRRGAVPALLPLAAAAVVAGGLRRALISGQLLAGRDGVVADPLGVVGGQAVALAVVTLGGCLAAAVVARRSAEAAARLPALGLVLLASAVSAVVVLQR